MYMFLKNGYQRELKMTRHCVLSRVYKAALADAKERGYNIETRNKLARAASKKTSAELDVDDALALDV